MTGDGKTGPEVNFDDVDEVLALASRTKQRDRDTLSVADVVEMGRELDIPEENVRKAIAALEAGRRRRRTIRVRAGVAAGAVFLLVSILALAGRASLRGALARVERERAQLGNVMDRQRAVQARYRDQPFTPDKDAELSGADNRVSVERRRYDEAASDYNERASSLGGKVWVRLFGLPHRVRLSSEGL